MLRWKGARLPSGREWFDLSVVGLMLLGIGTGLVVWAEQWVPSGPAALLVATSPFWVAGLERARPDGERAGIRALLGMLTGFTGLVLLVAPDLFGASLNGHYLLVCSRFRSRAPLVCRCVYANIIRRRLRR